MVVLRAYSQALPTLLQQIQKQVVVLDEMMLKLNSKRIQEEALVLFVLKLMMVKGLDSQEFQKAISDLAFVGPPFQQILYVWLIGM